MILAPPSVFGFLSASANARAAGVLDLGSGRSAALWRNHRDHVVYDGAEGHTFSLYVEGGQGTRRVDRQTGTGRPGALCVMPHRHRSEWDISSPFRFVHLYVPAEELGRAFADTFDRDARLLDVAEVTFAEAPRLAAVLRGVARAVTERDALAAEAAVDEVLGLFLADRRWGGARPRALKGGLAPFVGRRIDEYVEANLHRTIRLADLAGVAGLSAFHLQRAFRASRSASPQAFVARRRIERAKALLRGPDPICAIASACGFSSQSHLTNAFRTATGSTPASYRRAHGAATAVVGAPGRR